MNSRLKRSLIVLGAVAWCAGWSWFATPGTHLEPVGLAEYGCGFLTAFAISAFVLIAAWLCWLFIDGRLP